MSNTSKLITKSAGLLTENGFEQITSSHDQFEQKGITHTVFRHEKETYLVRAKEYCYQNLAPFGIGHVEHGVEKDAMLVIYFDDDETFHVFDPEWVKENGSEEIQRSKRSDQRVWLEVPLDDGVPLDDYTSGSEPRNLIENPGDNTINAGLDQFTDT